MQFVVDKAVFELIPSLRVAVFVCKQVTITPEQASAIQELYARYWREGAEAVSAFQPVQSHPSLAAWRSCYQQALKLSIKKYTSSVENLLKRAAKSADSPRSILPVVDLYNAVSVKYVLPFGAFDVDELGRDEQVLELKVLEDGQFSFQALDEEQPADLPKGEVAYVVDRQVVTRHINWKQSKLGLVSASSRNLVFMAEILGEIPESTVSAMIDDFKSLSTALLGVACTFSMLDSSHTSIGL